MGILRSLALYRTGSEGGSVNNLERELERLRDKAKDIESDITDLEYRLATKQDNLDEVRKRIEVLEIDMSFAEMDAEEAAAIEGELRQRRYLFQRYGTDLVRSIRDYWMQS